MQCASVIWSSEDCPAYSNFSHFLMKGTIFDKKIVMES